jgi:hypothetical protein
MLFHATNQFMSDHVEMGGNSLATVWHPLYCVVAQAEYHFVLIVEHPIPYAIAVLPVCEILQAHHSTSLDRQCG